MVPLDRALVSSYRLSIVTMRVGCSLQCTVATCVVSMFVETYLFTGTGSNLTGSNSFCLATHCRATVDSPNFSALLSMA